MWFSKAKVTAENTPCLSLAGFASNLMFQCVAPSSESIMKEEIRTRETHQKESVIGGVSEKVTWRKQHLAEAGDPAHDGH